MKPADSINFRAEIATTPAGRYTGYAQVRGRFPEIMGPPAVLARTHRRKYEP